MSETWELIIGALVVTILLVIALWTNLPTEPREKR